MSAISIMFVVLGIGAGLLLFTNTQQHAAAYQQSSESAYSLAEAALNAEIFQLSSQWPTTQLNAQNGGYPSACNASSNGALFCPNASSLSAAYTVGGGGTCPASTAGDAWGAPLTNGWTTYVRDDGPGTSTSQLFSSTVDRTQPAYDANGNGSVWVRSVGVLNCRPAVVLSKVSEQVVPITLPHGAITANGFGTENSGSKTIIDTLGSNAQPPSIRPGPQAQPGPVDVRCAGLTPGPPWAGSQCTNYAKEQVQPPDITQVSGNATTLTASQLAAERSLAQAAGTYWPKPNEACPTSLSELTGPLVFVEGPCTLSYKGNDVANSAASPGYMVLVNGTLELNGTSEFFGVIYAVNAQSLSGTPCKGTGGGSRGGDVVTIHGNAELQGAVIVDQGGDVCFGESADNFVYDPRGFDDVDGFAGAAQTPNSFRLLPAGQ